MPENNETEAKTTKNSAEEAGMTTAVSASLIKLLDASRLLIDKHGNLKMANLLAFLILAVLFGIISTIITAIVCNPGALAEKYQLAEALKKNEQAQRQIEAFTEEVKQLRLSVGEGSAKLLAKIAELEALSERAKALQKELELVQKSASYFESVDGNAFMLKDGRKASAVTNLNGNEECEITVKLKNDAGQEVWDWNNLHADKLTTVSVPINNVKRYNFTFAFKRKKGNPNTKFDETHNFYLKSVTPPNRLVYGVEGFDTTVSIDAQ